LCAIGEELMADLKLRLCENMRTIVWPYSHSASRTCRNSVSPRHAKCRHGG
jgi:hypothetical protein